MASDLMWQENPCLGCLVSYPHLCQECQTTLDHIIGFDEALNLAVEAPGQSRYQAEDIGESPLSYNQIAAWQFLETTSLPTRSFEASNGSHEELRGFESTATTSYPWYSPSPAGELDPHLLVFASENTLNLPDTDHTRQRQLHQTVNLAHTQAPSPRAEQSPQLRCDRPSRQSPGTICGQSFKQTKDLDRHIRTVHARGDDPTYRCSCHYKTTRKDNYMRHLRRCIAASSELRTYACICGFTNTQNTDHVTHLGRCGGHR